MDCVRLEMASCLVSDWEDFVHFHWALSQGFGFRGRSRGSLSHKAAWGNSISVVSRPLNQPNSSVPVPTKTGLEQDWGHCLNHCLTIPPLIASTTSRFQSFQAAKVFAWGHCCVDCLAIPAWAGGRECWASLLDECCSSLNSAGLNCVSLNLQHDFWERFLRVDVDLGRSIL